MSEALERPRCAFLRHRAGDEVQLHELAPCRCCCHEHTFESCKARQWFGCRGQYSVTRDEETSWFRVYRDFRSMSEAEFYGDL